MEEILHHLGYINLVNNGINYISTGAGFLPSTVSEVESTEGWVPFITSDFRKFCVFFARFFQWLFWKFSGKNFDDCRGDGGATKNPSKTDDLTSSLVNRAPPQTRAPLRNKALILGFIKGNQWCSQALMKDWDDSNRVDELEMTEGSSKG